MAHQRLPGHIHKEVKDALIRGASSQEVALLVNELTDSVISQTLPMLQPGILAKITCKIGCNHCCRQSAILIDEVDAQILSKHTGRPLHDHPHDRRNWKGVACAFLDKNGRCSVYEIRPLSCRTSLSVDAAEKCRTEENRQMIVTSELLEIISLDLMKPPLSRKYNESRGKSTGDIRDFFPPSTT